MGDAAALAPEATIGDGTRVRLGLALFLGLTIGGGVMALQAATYDRMTTLNDRMSEQNTSVAKAMNEVDKRLVLIEDRQHRLQADVGTALARSVDRDQVRMMVEQELAKLRDLVLLKSEANRFLDFPWLADRDTVMELLRRSEAEIKGLRMELDNLKSKN